MPSAGEAVAREFFQHNAPRHIGVLMSLLAGPGRGVRCAACRRCQRFSFLMGAVALPSLFARRSGRRGGAATRRARRPFEAQVLSDDAIEARDRSGAAGAGPARARADRAMKRPMRCRAVALGALTAGRLRQAGRPGWSGYVEGDYVYVAAPIAGALATLAVRRGQDVAARRAAVRARRRGRAGGTREEAARASAAPRLRPPTPTRAGAPTRSR